MTASRRYREEGWGVVKSLEGLIMTDRRWSHAQIFFLRPRVLIQSNEIKQSKTESFQWLARPASRQSSHLFSAPRGEVKSFSDREAGPVGKARKLFRSIPESFFSEGPRSVRLKKMPRNSGWGGR